MTVDSDIQNQEGTIIPSDNYGVKPDDSSFCAPQHFEEALRRKHKREGSLTGYTVIDGGVPWITAKRVEEIYQVLSNCYSLLNSGIVNAIPNMTLLSHPIKVIQEAIPVHKQQQLQELSKLLYRSVETHDIESIYTCFHLLNVLYIPQNVDENTLPHQDTLGYHLSMQKDLSARPEVINWLIASCILNKYEYQEVCWKFIREQNLYKQINYPGNCTISICENPRLSVHGEVPPPYTVFAYREILGSLSPGLYTLLNSGQNEVTITGYSAQVVCNIFDFLYCGTIDIDYDNLIPLLSFAIDYQIDGLTKCCKAWIESNMATFLRYDFCIQYFRAFSQCALYNISHLLCYRLVSLIAEAFRNEITPCDGYFVKKISPVLLDEGIRMEKFDAHDLINHPDMSRHLQEDDIDESFINVLTKYCPNLQHIDVSSLKGINDKCLFMMLTRCRNLKTLNVSNCPSVTKKGFSEAFEKAKAKLANLHLSFCGIKNGSCLIKMNSNFRDLSSLDLSGCSELNEKTAIALFDSLPELKSLNLNGCKKMTDKVLMKISERCTHVRELQLSDCASITDKGLSEISCSLRALTILNIQGCKKISDAPCYIIGKQLTEPTALVLGSTSITDSGISSLVLKLDNLTTLDISGTKATGASLVTISNKCRIQTINISNCSEVRDEHLMELAKSNPYIQELYLDGCHLITDNGLQHLIQSCYRLQVLSIAGCKKISKEIIMLLPSTSIELEKLYVSGCNLETKLQAENIKLQWPQLSVYT